MTKTYDWKLALFGIVLSLSANSQEIKTFSITDFDLRGSVKSCLVLTDYGREEYEFDESGLLIKSITRYNDSDYELTHYLFENGRLREKRIENYRDNVFDRDISLAHIYTLDSTAQKRITEQIVTYNKEFVDRYDYFYDASDRLQRIVRTNDEGTDETLIERDTLDRSRTMTYTLNGFPQKIVRIWERKDENDSLVKVVETKKFLEERPISSLEEVFEGKGDRLLSETHHSIDPRTLQMVFEKKVQYEYNGEGFRSSERTSGENYQRASHYVYQYDGTKFENWVKRIATPQNTYTTRRIKYYGNPWESVEDKE